MFKVLVIRSDDDGDGNEGEDEVRGAPDLS